jgi:hypothetical protein
MSSGPSMEMQNAKKDTWLVKNSDGKIVGRNLPLPKAEKLFNEVYMKGE